MQQHRIIVLLSVLVMLIIPVIGWFLVAQPQFAAAAAADAQRLQAATQVTATQQAVAKLKADSANLPALQTDLNGLRTSIPAEVDPSGYIDGLSALAKISKVQITRLGVDDPEAYTPAEPPAGAGSPPPADSGDGSTPAPGNTPAAPAAVPGLVTNPLVDASNFVAIPVTLEFTGKSSGILRFVHGLQSGDRLFLVTAVSTEPSADTSGGTLLGKVSGYIYAIPTGVPGDPHPVSTVVKTMDPPEPPETETPDPGSTGTPDPGKTDAPETP